MRKQSGPASTAVDSTAKWEKVSENKQTIIVGFFDDYESGNGQVFQKVASALRDDFRFAHSTDAAVVKASGQVFRNALSSKLTTSFRRTARLFSTDQEE
jgi:protein disulfide-isomerase A3